MSRLKILALILALAFLVHARSLGHGFIFDEHILIAENPAVTGFELKKIFGEKFWPGPTQGVYYRPLVILSYALGYALAGPSPMVQHLINLVLHLAACALAYLLLLRLTGRERVAALSALVFCVHPVHAESVDWIPGRTDVLAVVFVCLAWSLLLWARNQRTRARGAAIAFAALLAYLCALGSKEVAVALPALVIVHDLIFRGREAKKFAGQYAALLAASAAFLVFRAYVLSAPGLPAAPSPLAELGTGERALTILALFGLAFRVILLPHPYRIDYAYEEFLLQASAGRLALLALAAAVPLLAAGLGLKRSRLAAFSVFAVFISLLPVSHLISFPTLFAERFMYLPSLFVSLLAGLLIAEAGKPGGDRTGADARRGARPYFYRAVVVLLIFALALLSAARAGRFSDMIGFWKNAVSQTERPEARNLLGIAYRNKGRYQEAMKHYERAFQLDPGFTVARMNQAEILVLERRFEQAALALEDLVLDGHLDPVLIENLGYVYLPQGGWETKRIRWEKSLARDPHDLRARLLLALYHLKAGGDPAAGRDHLKAAASRDPRHPLVRALSRELEGPPP